MALNARLPRRLRGEDGAAIPGGNGRATFALNSRRPLPTIRPVFDALPHPADFQLAQCCLESEVAALRQFQQTYRQTVTTYLAASGASADEARDVVENLWADCVAGSNGRPAKLTRYNGLCSLQTWLNTVALNDFLTRKRREQRWNRLIPPPVPAVGADDSPESEEAWPASGSAEELSEAPLLDIMREAVQWAFLNCPAEDFVLLQLAHLDGLHVEELGLMFKCAKATISRNLKEARRSIEVATLAHIRQTDPWLDLKWEDFVELCQVASPACFGVE